MRFPLRLARKIAAKARQSPQGVPGGTFKGFNAACAVISPLQIVFVLVSYSIACPVISSANICSACESEFSRLNFFANTAYLPPIAARSAGCSYQ